MKFTSTASKYSSGPEAPLVRHQPWIHQFAFKYSEAGYRGSHLLWKVIFRLKVMPESTRVVLPNGFIVLTSGTDWNKNSIYKGQYERPCNSELGRIEIFQ